jgi:hypothetical protein
MEDFLRSLRTRDGTASTSLLMDKDKEKAFIDNLITVREQVCSTDILIIIVFKDMATLHGHGSSIMRR